MKPSRKKKIKLLLVDDHPIVLEGIKSHLSAQEGFEVVADASNGQEAVRQAQLHRPDVILMDISMPTMNGLHAMGQLRRRAPDSKVLVLTMHDNREYISQLVRLGARGYLLKDTAPAELVRAIRLVHAGEACFSPIANRVLLDELVNGKAKKTKDATSTANALTAREREVLILIAEGLSNKEIARKLGVSVRTVETHRERVMRKLSIRTVAGLTRHAIAEGIVKLH